MSDANPIATASEEAALDEAKMKSLSQLLTWRRRVGYGLGLASILGFVSLVVVAFSHLNALSRPPLSVMPFPILCLSVGGHVAVTIAAAYLVYQTLKAAERLAIPAHWVERNPHLLPGLLGIKDPMSALPEASATLEKILDPVGNFIERIKSK